MDLYELYEKGDELSDEHVICDVIVFDDGQCIAKWRGEVRSLVIHKSFDELKKISLNDNRGLWQTN